MSTKLLVLLLALLGTATAGPLSWDREVTRTNTRTCALQCSDKPTKFQYAIGTTYIYKYEVNTETSIAGASEDTGKLNIQTHAEIEVLNTCEYSIRLTNTQISYTDPYLRQLKTDRESEFQQAIERNTLRFSFDDGKILNVCPGSGEDIWVLNFKRGLLSAFQNSMNNFEKNQQVPEVDVTGDCEEVEYNVTKSWTWRQNIITITKSKNLLSCSKRDGLKSFLQLVPYTVPSDIKSLPFIKSTHTCEQKIGQEKILQSSSCKETHVYVPFSNYNSGGRTDVTQTLTYQRKKDSIDTLQGVIQSHQSLLFQHMDGNEEILRGQESAEQILKEICEQTTLEIRPETPKLFSELVQIVRTLDITTLRGVYQKLRKKTICPQNEKAIKFFLDTLPVAGSPGAVEMMLIVFRQDKINEVEKEAWLLTLGLVNNPSDEILPLLLKLLREPMTLQALLPVSSVVNNYCQKNANCADNYYISQLIDILDEKIDTYCLIDEKNKHMVMRTIRAIGNIGSSRKFVHTLDRCIRSKYAPVLVKVSAVNAYRRIPCPDSSKESDRTLITMLQDKTADPELRIASYQSLMRCPTDDVLKIIADQLNLEKSEEIGEYIYSHLSNLMKTSDPHKQDIAKAIRKLTLTKKFEANLVKSSRNYESSLLINKFNLGYVADADLIWSKSSHIPRAFKANLTMELFGNSLNLLEVGGRIEGMEYLAQKLFSHNENLLGKDKMWTADDLKLCLYGRIFGNELAFKHIEGKEYEPLLKDLWNADILTTFSKKINYDFTHSMQLFHGSLIVPTVVGLPMNITVNSSASVHLSVKGQIDLNKILARSRSFNINFDSLASAGLEVTGTMLIDAHFRKLGLRMRNTIHSTLPVKGRSSLSQTKGFNFEIDTPEKKIELFDARSKFFIIYDNYEKEQKMITENQKEYKICSGTTLAKITGFEMCGDLQFPNASMKSDAPYFPITGPTSLSLILHKKDTHSGYKVFAKWDKKKEHLIAQFQLNTPGSKVNRLISTDITLGYLKDKHIDVILNTPWKDVNLNGKLIWNKNVKRLVSNVRVDGEEYGLSTELIKEINDKEITYMPVVEIINRGESKKIISGQISIIQKKSISLSLDVNGLDKAFGKIKGKLLNLVKEKKVSVIFTPEGEESYELTAGTEIKMDNKGMRLTPEINLKTPKTKLAYISGGVDMRYDKLFKGKANIKIYPLETISMSTELKKVKDPKKAKTTLSTRMKVKSSAVNGDLSGNIAIETKLINSQLKIKYDIEKLGKDYIKWHGKYSDKSTNLFKNYKISSVSYFKRNPDYNTMCTLDIHQKKETKVGLGVKYGKDFKDTNKVVNIAAQFPSRIPDLKNAKVSGIITATFPEKELDMQVKLNHMHDTKKMDSSVNFHFLPFVDRGKITARTRFNPKDFLFTGDYTMKNTKLYSVGILSKMRTWNTAKWSVDMTSPERKIQGKANFRNEKERITGDALINWDAGRKITENSEISLVGSYRNSKKRDDQLIKGSLFFKSPFKNFENLNLKMILDKQPKELKSDGKIAWGKKKDNLSFDLTTSLPLSLLQTKLLLTIQSPFKSFRKINLNIDHKIKDDLMTFLSGKMNSAEGELSVKGNYDINDYTRNFKGEINLKTPFKICKEIQMTVDHSDDYEKYKTIAGLKHNSKTYKADFDMNHRVNGRDTDNRGKLTLISPEENMETVWSHLTENKIEKKIASKLKSTSNNKEIINVKISGTFRDKNSAQLEVDMATKWRSYRKLGLQLIHEINDKLLTSKAVFTKVKDQTGYDLQLLNDKGTGDVTLLLFLNPLYKRQISLKSNVNYENYPLTASAQLQWTPKTGITYDGSINALSSDNFDLSSKLTTPFENYENINVKSSMKRDPSELNAHLNIDYAVQKMIDIEARYRNDKFKKFLSTKIKSPSPYIKSFYAGLLMNSNNKMEVKADLDIQSLDEYGGHVLLRKENADIIGKVEIITPVEGYTSIKANGWMKTKRNSKKNVHVDFKTSSRNSYILDSAYKMDLPVELNINLRTPYPEFDNVGLDLIHDLKEGRATTHGSLTYLPKKTIELTLNFLYTPKLDGNLVIKTPFKTYEQNELKFYHDGETNDFNTHGSVILGERHISSDVKFRNTASKTAGEFTFISPLEELKKINGNFMVRGKIQNFKGDVSLQYGDKLISTEFSNRIRKDSLLSHFKMTNPFMEECIHISVDHVDKNVRNRRKIQSTQLWKFGRAQINLETKIDHMDMEDTNSFIKFNSSMMNVNINLERKADYIDFSGIMKHCSDIIDEIGLVFKSQGPIEDMKTFLNLTWHNDPVVEITMTTDKTSDKNINGRLTLQGNLFPKMSTEMKIVGDDTFFTAKATPLDGVMYSYEVSYRHNEVITDWKARIRYKYYEKLYTNDIIFNKDLSEDMDLHVKWLATVTNTFEGNHIYGFEIKHKGNLEKFTIENKIHLGIHGQINNKIDFFKVGLEHFEINGELTTPFKSYKDQSFKLRFEGQDTRVSTSINLKWGSNIGVLISLLMENSPNKIFTFTIESPNEKEIHLLLSIQLEEDGKLTSRVKVPDDIEYSLVAVYSDSVYPYHPHIELMTPISWLKDLTVDLKGQPLDGSADLVLLLNDDDKIEGKGIFSYDNIFSLTTSLSLDSTIKRIDDLHLELKNTKDQISRKSVFSLSLGPEKKIKISGDYMSKDLFGASDIDRHLLLDIIIPHEKFKTMSLSLGLQSDTLQTDGQIGFDLNSEKTLDMDLKYTKVDTRSVSVTVRKPKAMEYSLSQNDNGEFTENEIYINWNRDEPESNIRLKSKFKDVSDSSKTDKLVSVILIHPVRSVGLDHSYIRAPKTLTSAGKLFWNTDDNSKIFYNINLDNKSGRRVTFLDGDLKIGVPSRTLGLSGNFRNNAKQQVTDVTFSWDLDNDKTKRINLNTQVTGDEEVNADIKIKLPADVQVASKLILNKGNTIFDGTTDISYSWDDQKTLTFFSKLENNPGHYRFFSKPENYNYSIQFGIRHPDTKVDMTFDSHLGLSDDRMTSSFGLDYLTSYRQKKNTALWLEINKLKKEINLISTNPYKNVEISGSVLSDNPLRLQAITTTDDEERFKATLDMDEGDNKLWLNIGYPDSTLKLTALYPNKTTIQVDIDHNDLYQSHEEAAFILHLPTHRLLDAKLKWSPKVVEEVQNYLSTTINDKSDELKKLLSQIADDIEKEVTRKYRDVTSALSGDSKPLLNFVKQELSIMSRQFNILLRKWKRSETNNDLYLGDLTKFLNGVIDTLNTKLFSTAQEVYLNYINSQLEYLNTLPEKIEKIRNYPIHLRYRELVSDTITKSSKKIDDIANVLTQAISDTTQQLKDFEEYTTTLIVKSAKDVSNLPPFKALTEKLQFLKKIDLSPQIESYIEEIKDAIKQTTFATESNKLYQEVKWAYNYWQIEEKLPKYIQSSVNIFGEVVEEEILESLGHWLQIVRSPIRIYDSEKGILEVRLVLPIQIESLADLSKLIDYIEESGNFTKQFIDDVEKVVMKLVYVFMFPNN